MDNIRPTIEDVAKKVASEFVGGTGHDLTDLVIKAAKEAKMGAAQGAALVWLANRHTFANLMAKGASDEFKLADPGVVKLALQSNFYDENTSGNASSYSSPVKASASLTAQSAPKNSPVEMGDFIVGKLRNSDTDLKSEEKGVRARMRGLVDRIKGLLGGTKKAGLDATEHFAEKMAALAPDAKWLIENALAIVPFEKQAFISANTERAYLEAAKFDLDQACALATEAAGLRKRAKQIELDRQSIKEQIEAIRKEGIEVTR